ncbi:hypothetical protein BsWGS_26650 [Bradybaena similaris]
MIVPVFFLAFAAFLVEAQYPTTRTTTPSTTESAYPQPSNSKQEYDRQNPTDYQPSQGPSSNKPSNSKPSYGNSAPTTKGYSQGSSGDGSSKAQDDLYSRYPSSPVRNLRTELANAEAQLAAISRTDKLYNANLDIIEQKINKSTAYRVEFEEKIYPQLVASVDAQDKKIAEYRAQLRSLNVLIDLVRKLIGEVNFLTNRLATIRTRQVTIWNQLDKLQANDGAENLAIVAVEDQTDGNDQLLDIITSTRASNLAKYYDNLRDLEAIVAIVNEEQGELVTVELTSENKSVTVEYDQAFVTSPQLAYAIIALDIDKIKDDYKADEIIYPSVTAQGDARRVTISLDDSSVGWVTEAVTVRLYAFVINNNRSSQQEPTTKAYGDASTQKPSQNTTTTKAYGDASTNKPSQNTTTTKSYDGASTNKPSQKTTTKSYGGASTQKASRGTTTKAYDDATTTKAYIEA